MSRGERASFGTLVRLSRRGTKNRYGAAISAWRQRPPPPIGLNRVGSDVHRRVPLASPEAAGYPELPGDKRARLTARGGGYSKAARGVRLSRNNGCGGWLTHQLTASGERPAGSLRSSSVLSQAADTLTHVAVSAVTSTFVGVTIVAAITTVSNAVLAVIRLATYLRDPFRGLRRLHQPMPGRIAMYRIPTTGPRVRELPQGADPRAWSWRAARPRRAQRPRT